MRQGPGVRQRRSRCCAGPAGNGGGHDSRRGQYSTQRWCGGTPPEGGPPPARGGAAQMIVELPDTSTNEINKKLDELREQVGAVNLGRVLTLVIAPDSD